MSPERLSWRVTALNSKHSYSVFIRQKKLAGILIVLGSVIVLSIAIYVLNEVLYGGIQSELSSGEMILKAGLPLLIVLTLAFGYLGLLKSVNYTQLKFTGHSLKICNRPLPWKGELKFHTKNITAFEIEEHANGVTCIKLIFNEGDRSKCVLENLSPDEARAILRDLKSFHEKAKLRRAKKEHARGVQELVEA